MQEAREREEQQQREASELDKRTAQVARSAPSPAKAASAAAPAPLNDAAAKAEEERLLRAMNNKATPSVFGGGAKTTPTPTATTPTTTTTSNETAGVPEWKRRQLEREKEAEAAAKRAADEKSKAIAAANEATASKPREPTPGATSTPAWEPKKSVQSVEDVAKELGAPTGALASSAGASAASSSAAVRDERIDSVKCAACNIFIVGGYKNALGRAFHKECWKCIDCGEPLQAKFANINGKPACVPCATARVKKAKEASK